MVEQQPTFQPTARFLAVLRTRVNAHFAGASMAGNRAMIRKAAISMLWFVASFAVVLAAEPLWLKLLGCVSWGLAAAAVGFNIFHDSVHGSFSDSRRLNRIVAVAVCFVLGPSRFLWIQKHHVFHHRFTNIHEWDDDVEARGFLRLAPSQDWRWQHRFQVITCPVLYMFTTVEWFFVKDFRQYVSGKLNPYLDVPPMKPVEHLEFWATKVFYIAVFVALPIWALGLQTGLICLAAFHATFGLVLTSVFQLAHLNDVAAHLAQEDGEPLHVEDEWAVHQLRTTVNFAMASPWAAWFMGGLNFQVEHHLFPGICHIHYPAIAPIVARTAREFGYPYHTYDTYPDAIAGHFRLLRALSVPA